MYNPSLKEFLKLAKKFNVIPVYKEISADLDTPVSSFLKIRKNDYAFLLESVEGQKNIARYSFLGTTPEIVFKSRARNIEIKNFSERCVRKFITAHDPLTEVKKIMSGYRSAAVAGLPRFYGGFVGYIGYDMVRFFENIPDKNPDELKLPDCVLMLTDNILVFDHVNHTMKIIYNVILPRLGQGLSTKEKIALYNRGVNKIEAIHSQLKSPIKSTEPNKIKKESALKIRSNFKKAEFCRLVNRAKNYIRSGDIIQVVLSQRFKIKISKEPFDIYRHLRGSNPSPYMFYLKLKEVTLIGSSPEMLVRCEDGVLESRPIAGTRPRGKTEVEDKFMEKELLGDAKEKAEHLMLVDLGRNDLGRVSKPGTVKVNEFMRVERYSHVMHLVSDIVGELNRRYDAYDVLKACFPAGTVSGSPKVRAMEIIDELENTRRGPYAGCVGYFSFSGNMDTGITLRTIILKGKLAYIQAGAGIVLDSLPHKEYTESLNKARALLEAIRG